MKQIEDLLDKIKLYSNLMSESLNANGMKLQWTTSYSIGNGRADEADRRSIGQDKTVFQSDV